MRWIVGVDLRSSGGALQFARWLARESREPETFVGVHVVEEADLRVVLRFRTLEAVMTEARDAVQKAVESAGPTLARFELRVLGGGSAEDRLEEVRRAEAADALVIGRLASRGTQPMVRLGRVARRLLRRMAAPVAVVPPDLAERDLGDGPVLALARPSKECLDAVRTARALATALGRRLAVLHVIGDPLTAVPYGISHDQVAELRDEELELARTELTAWLGDAGVAADEPIVRMGSLVEEASALADEVRAPVMAAGARHASATEALLAMSLGRELAAYAKVPVLLVPELR